MYVKHWNNYFWGEKEADFARTAEEVWAQEKQSGAACQYIAEYLFSGLDHYPRAIEILLDAHRREVLDEGGQSRLVELPALARTASPKRFPSSNRWSSGGRTTCSIASGS